jgi:hypothetical protein
MGIREIESSFRNDCRAQKENPCYVINAIMDGRFSPEYGIRVVDYVEGSFGRRMERIVLALVDTLVGG